jgi:hypothetical protein
MASQQRREDVMDKQLIERLAREAGANMSTGSLAGHPLTAFPDGSLERFATLVAEECAKIIQVRGNRWDDAKARAAAEEVADAIRARFGALEAPR